jgi:hypothetical protein
MTQADLILAVEQELRLRGIHFSLGDLQRFIEDVWPLASEDPDPAHWAQEFIDAGNVEMTA